MRLHEIILANIKYIQHEPKRGPSAAVDLTLNTAMQKAKHTNTVTAKLIFKTHCQRGVNSPPPALPPHLTTWQSLCVETLPEGETITRGGALASSQVKMQKKKKKRLC